MLGSREVNADAAVEFAFLVIEPISCFCLRLYGLSVLEPTGLPPILRACMGLRNDTNGISFIVTTDLSRELGFVSQSMLLDIGLSGE